MVKSGFKPVPPQLYFEFAAFFLPSLYRNRVANSKLSCEKTVLNPGFTVQASLQFQSDFSKLAACAVVSLA